MSNGEALPLIAVYNGWQVYQQKLVQAVAPLTPEQLELRAAPHLRSIGMLIAHIIATRAGWFHRVMGEGEPELEQISDWDEEWAEQRSAAELVQGLEVTWQTVWGCLERWTTAELEHVYRPERAGKTYTFTRQWVIWHVIEHDLHHGGELGFSLGMHGLEAPDL